MPKEIIQKVSTAKDIQSGNIELAHSGEYYFLRLRNIISKAKMNYR